MCATSGNCGHLPGRSSSRFHSKTPTPARFDARGPLVPLYDSDSKLLINRQGNLLLRPHWMLQ